LTGVSVFRFCSLLKNGKRKTEKVKKRFRKHSTTESEVEDELAQFPATQEDRMDEDITLWDDIGIDRSEQEDVISTQVAFKPRNSCKDYMSTERPAR
jgi:hypothetical protein